MMSRALLIVLVALAAAAVIDARELVRGRLLDTAVDGGTWGFLPHARPIARLPCCLAPCERVH